MASDTQTSTRKFSAAHSQGRSQGLQRALDRYLGPPILWILGLFRTRREKPAMVYSIGLLKTTAIGDTVILSGTVATLRASFPSARLVLFAGPSNEAAAKMLEVDEVVRIEPTRPWSSIREIRKHPVDVWIDFGSWSKLEAVYSFFANAKLTIGFQSDGQARHFAYDRVVIHRRGVHENVNYHELLKPLDVSGVNNPRLFAPSRAQVADLPPSPFVIFHLWPGGSQAKAKEWPLENWQRLAQDLNSKGWTVALTGGPGQREANAEFLRNVRAGVNLAGMSLDQTAKVLSQANLVISVDTGVLHLASALGAPLIALHGPTHSERWGALDARAISLNSLEPSVAPIHFGWENVTTEPMKKITVEQVMEAVEKITKPAKNPHPSSL